MLRDASTVFDATHTLTTDLAGSEVSGNGWTAGGETLASAARTLVNTNQSKLDATDISVTATGGSIGPATSGVIYDSTDNKLIAFVDFDGSETASVGKDFDVLWPTAGIVTWT